MEKVSVSIAINVTLEKVWSLWTQPIHIMHWNAASPDWQTSYAVNDLRKGGEFTSHMEAKDGSFEFDFSGKYDVVKLNEQISYVMDDGRKVNTIFNYKGEQTIITTVFDPEIQNPIEMQRDGWLAILDSFKNYAENLNDNSIMH